MQEPAELEPAVIGKVAVGSCLALALFNSLFWILMRHQLDPKNGICAVTRLFHATHDSSLAVGGGDILYFFQAKSLDSVWLGQVFVAIACPVVYGYGYRSVALVLAIHYTLAQVSLRTQRGFIY